MVREISNKRLIGIIILSLIFGSVSWELIEDLNEKTRYRGLLIKSEEGKIGALSKASYLEPDGDWICINVEDITFKELIDTCTHEVAHEIFARKCTDQKDKCLEVFGDEK